MRTRAHPRPSGSVSDAWPEHQVGSTKDTDRQDYIKDYAVADFDRDGRLDYFGPQWYAEERSPLLRNVTEGALDYISIRMDIPGEKNRNGIGATVRIYKPGKAGDDGALLGIKCISVSNGYSGGSMAEAHFGTPGQDVVDITISMPCSGNIYTIRSVKTRQLFTFTPGKD